MATATANAGTQPAADDVTLVDPRTPRFGQAITAVGLSAGIVLGAPAFIFAIAVILNTALLSRWRFHPYGLVWRHVVTRFIDAADELEPAAPHRFATVIGAVGTAIASVAILGGVPIVGYVLAGGIAVAAGLGAASGFCLGCYFYQHVSLFRRLSIV